MAKASTPDTGLIADCRNSSFWLGRTLVLTEDFSGLSVGTHVVVDEVYVDTNSRRIHFVLQHSDDLEMLAAPANLFTTEDGVQAPACAVEIDGELSIPMNEDLAPVPLPTPLAPLPAPAPLAQMPAPLPAPLPAPAPLPPIASLSPLPLPPIAQAAPAYPQPTQNPLDAIFEAFAPKHPIADTFKQSYQLVFGTDVAALQLEMQAQQLLSTSWTIEQTALMCSNILRSRGLNVPEPVETVLREAAAQREAERQAELQALESIVPEAETTPVVTEAAPVAESTEAEEKKPGRRGRPPKTVVAEVPAPVAADAPVATSEKAPWPKVSKLSSNQIASVSALLSIYQNDRDNFEENVSVAMDAIRALL